MGARNYRRLERITGRLRGVTIWARSLEKSFAEVIAQFISAHS